MIITVIAETLSSLLVVSMVYLPQHLGYFFRILLLLHILYKNCVSNFQETLFAKQLVVLGTFPECEAIFFHLKCFMY